MQCAVGRCLILLFLLHWSDEAVGEFVGTHKVEVDELQEIAATTEGTFQKNVKSTLGRLQTPPPGATVFLSTLARVASKIGPSIAIIGRSLQRQWKQKIDKEILLMNTCASLLPASVLDEFIAVNLLNGVLSGDKQRQMILQTWIRNLQLAARLFLSSQIVEMGSMAVWDLRNAERNTGTVGKNHWAVALSPAYKQTVLVLFVANGLYRLIQITFAAKTKKRSNDRISDNETSSLFSVRHLVVSLISQTSLSFLVVLAAGCAVRLVWELNLGCLSSIKGWWAIATTAILGVMVGIIVPMGTAVALDEIAPLDDSVASHDMLEHSSFATTINHDTVEVVCSDTTMKSAGLTINALADHKVEAPARTVQLHAHVSQPPAFHKYEADSGQQQQCTLFRIFSFQTKARRAIAATLTALAALLEVLLLPASFVSRWLLSNGNVSISLPLEPFLISTNETANWNELSYTIIHVPPQTCPNLPYLRRKRRKSTFLFR